MSCFSPTRISARSQKDGGRPYRKSSVFAKADSSTRGAIIKRSNDVIQKEMRGQSYEEVPLNLPDLPLQNKAVSFLEPSSLKWINKHRKTAGTGLQIMSASHALALRNVFRGLDFHKKGTIPLKDIKKAITYIASQGNDGGPPIISDPVKMVQLFENMDTDKDGVVDFDEFLRGITSQVSYLYNV
jgi:hypothetical protein